MQTSKVFFEKLSLVMLMKLVNAELNQKLTDIDNSCLDDIAEDITELKKLSEILKRKNTL